MTGDSGKFKHTEYWNTFYVYMGVWVFQGFTVLEMQFSNTGFIVTCSRNHMKFLRSLAHKHGFFYLYTCITVAVYRWLPFCKMSLNSCSVSQFQHLYQFGLFLVSAIELFINFLCHVFAPLLLNFAILFFLNYL